MYGTVTVDSLILHVLTRDFYEPDTILDAGHELGEQSGGRVLLVRVGSVGAAASVTPVTPTPG